MLKRVPGIRATVHYNNNIFRHDIEIEDGEKRNTPPLSCCTSLRLRTVKPECYIGTLSPRSSSTGPRRHGGRRKLVGIARLPASFGFFLYFCIHYSLLRIRRPSFSCNVVPMDLSARHDCRCAFLSIYLHTSVCFSVFSGHTHH